MPRINKTLNERGTVLLQALIFVVIISILGAAVMRLNLGGFLGTANIIDASVNQAEGQAVLPQVYADIEACDPNMTGACGAATYVMTWPPMGNSFTRGRGETGGGSSGTRDFTIVRSAWNGTRYDIQIIPQ